jgi:SAM-dependent methyltransferase
MMTDYLAWTYGDRIADTYDSLHAEHDPATIDLLAELAGDGPALELGIGTGRVALPLASRGIAVHGIDASQAMVARLRAKAGGAEIPVAIADFKTFEFEERFSLIYVVFNTFFALQSQEEQVRCFQSVAAHLRGDGCFLIEAFVPDLARFDRGQRVSASNIESHGVTLEVSRHDPVLQRVESQIVRLSEAGMRLFPVQIRYAWPSELDLMARLANLVIRDRWAGWRRQPFGPASQFHVSVYRRGG